MRKLINIAIGFFTVLILIFSFLFIIIEGRLVFSGDWKVYDNVFNGLIRYLLRLLLSILVFGISIVELVNLKLQKENLFYYLLYFDLGLIIMSLLTLIFAANYIGIICVIFIFLITLLKFYYYILVYKNSGN